MELDRTTMCETTTYYNACLRYLELGLGRPAPRMLEAVYKILAPPSTMKEDKQLTARQVRHSAATLKNKNRPATKLASSLP